MQRVQLPGGAHAVLRDKVNVGGRQVLQRTSPAAFAAYKRVRKIREDAQVEDTEISEDTPIEKVLYTESEIEALQRWGMAGVVALLKHWSLDEPVPRTIEEVEDMDPAVYEAITAAATPLAWKALARPSSSEEGSVVEDENGRPVPVPEHPTGPSNGSDAAERAFSTPAPLDTSSTTSLPNSSESTTSEAALVV